MKTGLARTACALLATVLSAAALAGTSYFPVVLDASSPKMDVQTIATPNCGTVLPGSPVSYKAIPFTVTQTGAYTLSSPFATDALYVHANAFNPANPVPTCLAASNSNPISLNVPLAAGTQYYAVVIDDSFAQGGVNTVLTVTGPGSISGLCADFTDVDAASGFCANVQWLRNRAITQGCTATQYCPNTPVTRLQMAAFLNRMGNALTPAFVVKQLAGASATVNAGGEVCVTNAYLVSSFPRVASVSSVMFYHSATAAVDVSTRLVYSLNGAAWQDFGDFVTTAANVAGKYASQSPAAVPRVVSAGNSVRFAIQVSASPATVSDAGCELAVRLESATVATPPFDAAPGDASAAPGPSGGR